MFGVAAILPAACAAYGACMIAYPNMFSLVRHPPTRDTRHCTVFGAIAGATSGAIAGAIAGAIPGPG